MPARSGTRNLVAVRVAPNPTGALDELFVLAAPAMDGHAAFGADTALAAAIEGLPRADGESLGMRRLRVFHFNDLHHALQAPASATGPAPLFSRIVHRYRVARAVAAPCEVVLLLSGG